MEECCIYSGNNNIKIEEVKSILKENDIPFKVVQPGLGQYMNIYGYSNQNTNIIINIENKKKAEELIETINQNDIEISEEEEEDIKKYNNLKRYGVIGLVCIPIAVIIVAVVIATIRG